MPIAPLTVVVVHWNQSVRLEDSLARLREQGVPVRALVVDNGSDPTHLARVRTLVAREDLIEQERNTGFGPAANAGFRRWLDEGEGEWVGLMPHDALPEVGALGAMLALAATNDRLGLFSADVGDGATPVVDPYLGGITKPAEASDGFEPADHPHGTLMLARRALLTQVGMFDERYFAYCEEADLGLRARAAGWDVGLARGTMVVNPEMGPGSPAVAYLQLRNTLLLVAEHSSRYHATVRAIIGLGQIGWSMAVPRSRDHLHHPKARLLGIRDWTLGRYGPPPASLTPPAAEARTSAPPT